MPLPANFDPRFVLDPTMTTVEIGAEHRAFTMHKSFLCSRSNYFKSAYSSGLAEAQANRFVINDISTDTFAIFVAWLYSDQIYLSTDSTDALELECEEHGADSDSEREWFEEQSEQDEVDDMQWDAHEDADNNWAIEHASHPSSHFLVGYYDPKDIRNFLPGTDEHTRLCDLDAYQLKTLLHCANAERVSTEPETLDFVGKLRVLLEEKKVAIPTLENPYETLTDLYILADRFDVPALRDLIMNHLQSQREHARENNFCDLPSFATVIRAFDNLPEKSKLRVWLIHTFAYDWDPDADDEDEVVIRAQLPKDFLMEVMLLNTKRVPKRLKGEVAPFEDKMCYYHEHQTLEEVASCSGDAKVLEPEDEDEEGNMA